MNPTVAPVVGPPVNAATTLARSFSELESAVQSTADNIGELATNYLAKYCSRNSPTFLGQSQIDEAHDLTWRMREEADKLKESWVDLNGKIGKREVLELLKAAGFHLPLLVNGDGSLDGPSLWRGLFSLKRNPSAPTPSPRIRSMYLGRMLILISEGQRCAKALRLAALCAQHFSRHAARLVEQSPQAPLQRTRFAEARELLSHIETVAAILDIDVQTRQSEIATLEVQSQSKLTERIQWLTLVLIVATILIGVIPIIQFTSGSLLPILSTGWAIGVEIAAAVLLGGFLALWIMRARRDEAIDLGPL